MIKISKPGDMNHKLQDNYVKQEAEDIPGVARDWGKLIVKMIKTKGLGKGKLRDSMGPMIWGS